MSKNNLIFCENCNKAKSCLLKNLDPQQKRSYCPIINSMSNFEFNTLELIKESALTSQIPANLQKTASLHSLIETNKALIETNKKLTDMLKNSFDSNSGDQCQPVNPIDFKNELNEFLNNHKN